MKIWSTTRQSDRAVESNSVSSHDRREGKVGKRDDNWFCGS